MSYELLGLGTSPPVTPSPPEDVPETKPFTFGEFVGSSFFAFVVGMVAMHLIDRYTLGTVTTHDRRETGDLDRGRFALQRREAARAMSDADQREAERIRRMIDENHIIDGVGRAYIVPKNKSFPFGHDAGMDYGRSRGFGGQRRWAR